MTITEIEYGSLASSKKLNDNFNALNKDIQDLATSLSVTNANIATNISTLNKNITNQITDVNESLSNNKTDLEEKLKTLDKSVSDLKNNQLSRIMPNWSKKVNRGTSYTLTEDCWVYLVATVGWSATSSSNKAGDVCIGGGLGRGDSSMRCGGMWIGVKGETISGSFTIFTIPFVGRSA